MDIHGMGCVRGTGGRKGYIRKSVCNSFERIY